jgi:hypothetical protein
VANSRWRILGDTPSPQPSNDQCVCNAHIGAIYVGSTLDIYMRTTISSPCQASDWTVFEGSDMQICDCCDETFITPKITVSEQVVCVGDEVTFTDDSILHDSSEDVCTYSSTEWDFDDGDTTTGLIVNHTFDDPGLYFVTATTECTNGTTAVQTIIIKVIEIVTLFTVSSDTVDTEEEITITNLTNVDGCEASYLWDFDDGSTSTSHTPGVIEYVVAGTYDITLTVTCADGCEDVYAVEITVTDP